MLRHKSTNLLRHDMHFGEAKLMFGNFTAKKIEGFANKRSSKNFDTLVSKLVGRYKVNNVKSLPALGIIVTSDVFQLREK